METDIFNKATKLKKSINYYDLQLSKLEKLYDYWKKNNIKINDHNEIIFDEENNAYRLKERTTFISILDNKANVQISNVDIPIEILEELIKYYKNQKEEFEKEFEKL